MDSSVVTEADYPLTEVSTPWYNDTYVDMNGAFIYPASYNITYVEDCSGYLSSDNAMSSGFFHGTVYFMYCSIFVVALTGNGLVCFIVRSTPRMRTVTNYFIVNLAIGDMMMTVLCGPFTFLSMFILYYWPFGSVLCYLVNYSQAVSVFVSAYTLVAISIDRYMGIMWPLRPRMSKRSALIIIGTVWFFAFLTALPIPIMSQLVQPSNWHVACDRYVCREEWPNVFLNEYYSMALMVLQYLVPLFVFLFTYTSIALVVWCQRIPGEAEDSRDQRMARSKRKMIKMMVIVVTVFTMCWLPFNILMILMTMNVGGDSALLPYIWFILHWLAMSHSCYNPIIYCYLNARFRTGFIQSVLSVACCRQCIPISQRPRLAEVALQGMTTSDQSIYRVNTCTTYVTVRRKRGNGGMANECSCDYPNPLKSLPAARNHPHLQRQGQSPRPNTFFAEDQI